jgi:hypothetical protein
MSYRVNRANGYQRWGVTNPWVWANFGQPQRGRGYVSPIVFQTQSPKLKSAYLGDVTQDVAALLNRSDEELARARRMERYAAIGVSLSALSAFMLWYRLYGKKSLAANRRRRRKR